MPADPRPVEDGARIELLGIGGAAAAALPALNWPRHLASARTPIKWLYGTGLPMAFVIVPTLLAGAGVLISGLGGLSWLPVITVAALLGSLLQAWVLLIEIPRLPKRGWLEVRYGHPWLISG
jgi:hypothetical protein